MNIRNKPELIVSLAGVAGHARRVLSHNIQQNLFRLGYKWQDGGVKPQNLEAAVLHIHTPEWNPMHITFEKDGPAYACGVATFYDGVTQSDIFLAAAKNALVEKRNIRGVDVTITPDEIKMDTTNLLATVSGEATMIQRELFERD